MAISGRFVADFDDFNSAVKGAETKLVSFETGASKVTSSLQRMETSLSGKKLIQDATLAVQAVENIGGVSKVSEATLQRLAVQAKEAADQMRRMGIDVPPGMQKIADEAKGADTAHGSLIGTVKNLALGFAAMFSARAAFNFVKDTINEASALKDLSTQTHIGVEELQVLAGGMSEFGVDADELGKGLFKLSRGIAGGDESVAHGLHLMGMSLKDVEGLNGKDLFLKIMSGLAALQGGLQDTASAELFGGKLGAAMAGASKGIEGAIETWQHLNHVASSESVDALDEFGEAIERSTKSLKSMATNLFGPLAQEFNVMFDAVAKGASKWDLAMGVLPKGLGLIGTGQEGLATAIDHANIKIAEQEAASKKAAGTHLDVAAALDTRSQAVKFMASLEADAAVTLTADQVKNLEHLKDIGALNAKNAEGIGVGAAAYAKYTAEVAKAAKAETDRAAAAAKAHTEWESNFDKEMKRLTADEAFKRKLKDDTNKAVIDGNAAIMAADADLAAIQAKQYMTTAEFEISQVWRSAKEQIDAFKGTAEQAARYAEIRKGIAQEQENVILSAITRTMTAEEALLAKLSKDAVTTFAVIGKSADDVATKVEATAAKVADFNQAAAQYSMYGGTPSTPASRHAYDTSPDGIRQNLLDARERFESGLRNGRDSGGPVTAGRSYLIGTGAQPELFTPGANGFMTPNGGGGTTITNHIYVTQPFGTPDAIGEAIVTRQRGLGVRFSAGA